jgi:restriction system protein
MVRRGRKPDLNGGVGLVVIAGALWLVGKFFERLPEGSGTALVHVIYGLGALTVVYLIARFFARHVRARQVRFEKARALEALLRKAQSATEQQLMSLVRRRAQLVQQDPYGQQKMENWGKEIRYFISNQIEPSLTQDEYAALGENFTALVSSIEDTVRAAMLDQPPFQTFSDEMKPAEFEAFCAEELRRAGWDARVTMQSRDQGVDVVAEKNHVRVVIQCKLYARPVGNKSVQEAAAGKAHEPADYGIVVTNNRYTLAAEQLAATNGVLLLHYRDLQNLEGILSQKR